MISDLKWVAYFLWMVILLRFIGEAVVFPSVEIERIFVFIFVLGSGLITAIIGESKK